MQLPEALVAEGPQAAAGRQALERLALEHDVGRRAVRATRLQAEEAAVDPQLAAGLLDEPGDRPGVVGGAPRRTGARGWTTAIVAGRVVTARGRRAAARGRRRRRRRRRSRQKSAVGQAAAAARCRRPPVGVSLAGVQAADLGTGRPCCSRTRTPRPGRPGTRSTARSGESPGRGRSESRATGSGARRSRPAAWGSSVRCSCRRVPRPPQRMTTLGLTAARIHQASIGARP